jgi:outer membrane protein X
MKKLFFASLFITALSLSVFAQKGEKSIGVTLGYAELMIEERTAAIGVKFNYGITDQIRLSPSINYLLPKYDVSGWEINADVHYLFAVAPKIKVYPLAGLTFVGRSLKGEDGNDDDEYEEWQAHLRGDDDYGNDDNGKRRNAATGTRFGINLGGGIGYELTDKVAVGLELKYSVVSDIDQFVPTVNLTYKF